LPCLFTTYRPTRYFDRHARIHVRAWFLVGINKRITEYVFAASFATIDNRRYRNTRLPGGFANGKERFAGRLTNNRLSLFDCPSNNARSRIDVVFRRTPFQIVGPVVGLDFVFVVYLRQMFRIRYESQSDQPINAETAYLSILAKRDACISIPGRVGFKNLAAFQPTNTAHCANLVQPDIFGYIFPNFVVHNKKNNPRFRLPHTNPGIPSNLRLTCMSFVGGSQRHKDSNYFRLCGFRARIWAANSGRFLHI